MDDLRRRPPAVVVSGAGQVNIGDRWVGVSGVVVHGSRVNWWGDQQARGLALGPGAGRGGHGCFRPAAPPEMNTFSSTFPFSVDPGWAFGLMGLTRSLSVPP